MTAEAIQRASVFALLRVLRGLRLAASRWEPTYKLLFLPGFEGFRWRVGRWRAWLVYEKARRRVPAYRAFLHERGDPRPRVRRFVPDLDAVPVTDKENYVKRYSVEERCYDGRIPSRGVVIDESSGTSGTPNNWVRGPEERREVRQALQVALHEQLGDEPLFFLNAFALGPWATGMNVAMSLVDVTILKCVGPDAAKIENTLRTFGPRYRYAIAGYPPFLKTLVDTADVDWSRYELIAIYGGEGMSEGMRRYLGRAFDAIYGSYGASDLEINIAAESDFTIALRRLIAERDDVRARLCRFDDGGLPLVFQYNPIDYFVETSDEGTLVVTVCRAKDASPKIRYDIRDRGHVLRYPELVRDLAAVGVDARELGGGRNDLPVLFLYGRADQAVPYFGAKITPANVDEVVFALPELSVVVNSFALVLDEDEQATKRLAIAFELREGAAEPRDVAAVRTRLLETLSALNQDFREASRFMPTESVPTVEFHAPQTGPFAAHDVRLKRHYLQKR